MQSREKVSAAERNGITNQEKEFLQAFERILQVEPGSVSLSDSLASMGEWDSLAVLNFLTLADGQYGVSVAPTLLKESNTVADLMKLVLKPVP